jgi:hypothetical protein
MAYFPESMPRPSPTMDDAGFWDSCRRQRLSFQACSDCEVPRHPPTPVCAHCHSLRSKWVPVSGRGEVYTFTVVHHASHPAVKDKLPYVGALITFDDLPGVRLVSNVTHCDPADVRIGMKLDLWWDDIGGDQHVPRFRPRRESAT